MALYFPRLSSALCRPSAEEGDQLPALSEGATGFPSAFLSLEGCWSQRLHLRFHDEPHSNGCHLCHFGYVKHFSPFGRRQNQSLLCREWLEKVPELTHLLDTNQPLEGVWLSQPLFHGPTCRIYLGSSSQFWNTVLSSPDFCCFCCHFVNVACFLGYLILK